MFNISKFFCALHCPCLWIYYLHRKHLYILYQTVARDFLIYIYFLKFLTYMLRNTAFLALFFFMILLIKMIKSLVSNQKGSCIGRFKLNFQKSTICQMTLYTKTCSFMTSYTKMLRTILKIF